MSATMLNSITLGLLSVATVINSIVLAGVVRAVRR
jgi:hypothetical protein